MKDLKLSQFAWQFKQRIEQDKPVFLQLHFPLKLVLHLQNFFSKNSFWYVMFDSCYGCSVCLGFVSPAFFSLSSNRCTSGKLTDMGIKHSSRFISFFPENYCYYETISGFWHEVFIFFQNSSGGEQCVNSKLVTEYLQTLLS